MARVDAIPLGTPIVDPQDGTITAFFRLRWDSVQQATQVLPAIGAATITVPQAGAIGTTRLFTARVAGFYVLLAYLRKTTPAAGSSSLQLTWGWTDHGTPLTDAQPALTTDTSISNQSLMRVVYADANSDVTYSLAYASSPPGMQYVLALGAQQVQGVG